MLSESKILDEIDMFPLTPLIPLTPNVKKSIGNSRKINNLFVKEDKMDFNKEISKICMPRISEFNESKDQKYSFSASSNI